MSAKNARGERQATNRAPATRTMNPATLESSYQDSQNVRRVLRALRARRTLGWHMPAHFLELSYEVLEADEARVNMPLGPHCLDSSGAVHRAAITVLADVAMAGALRVRFGAAIRLATVSIRLNFANARAEERLQASARCGLDIAGAAVPLTVCAVRIMSGDELVCSGEATFVVLGNRSGAKAQPLPLASTLEGVEPLRVEELTAEEVEAHECALRADSLAFSGVPFIQAFWGLMPKEADGRGECVLERGVHVCNRVGDVQGGVLLGLAAQTSAALMSGDWRVIDASARYLAPADTGRALHGRSESVRTGRNMAFVECVVSDESGRVSMRSEVTMARIVRPE